MAGKKPEPELRGRVVKVPFTDKEIKNIRVAAALDDCSAPEFGRRAMMERVDGILKRHFSRGK